ncbi:hypothetical protein [Streptomyces sp. NBRC 110028]|uniref:hypothetical protein n=1 Tax=Streptomyces sp. NBRC 110028 TaxID=1621260 RepID=UPI0007C65540|nr:hypothetical protein [Streptomyces sp. NBRC 110028]
MSVLKSTYPSAPDDTLVFENDRVRVCSTMLEPEGMYDVHQHHHDYVILCPGRRQAVTQRPGNPDRETSLAPEPGFMWFQAVDTAKPLISHRVRKVSDTAVTHYIIERSPSEKRLPAETNSRGPFVNGTCEGRK